MKDLSKLKYKESDEATFKGLLATSYLEEDNTLEGFTGLYPGTCVIINPEEVEDNTATPSIHSYTPPARPEYPLHGYVSWGSTCIVAKPERYFHTTGLESNISISGIYTLETDMETSIGEVDFIRSSQMEEALKVLSEVYHKCLEANWDGYGSAPITYDSYLEASKLFRMIPSSFPMPDILPEPDGEIGLEWYRENDLVFSISFSGKNIITYAGLFGKNNEAHGTEYFTDSIPKTILDFLKRLFSSIE